MPKKSKKSKKHKKLKEKQHTKRKHARSGTRESESNSSDESSEYEWTEKQVEQAPQMAKREDWMSETCFVSTFSINDVKKKKKNEKTIPDRNFPDKPDVCIRELNPYWKNGGNGLPEERENDATEVKLMSNTVGDQGADWLKRALRRAKEQASDEGIPLEHIVAERYGSLENLYRLIHEAEARQKYSKNESSHRDHYNTYEASPSKVKNRFMKPGDDNNKSYDTLTNNCAGGNRQGWRKQKKSEEREGTKQVDKPIHSSRSSHQGWRKQNYSEEKEEIKKVENFQRSNSSHQSCRKQEQSEESGIAKRVEENIPAEEKTENILLTDAEMNSLASRILKAEIIGNTSLVKELSNKLETARKCRETAKCESTDKFVLLTTTNSRGITHPVSKKNDKTDNNKRKTYQTHADGKRVRYFEDDEKYSLAEMFESEQMKTAADSNVEFAQLAAKTKAEKDYDVDDLFMEQMTTNKSKKEKDLRQSAIDKQKATEKALDNCTWCLTNNKLQKHLLVSTGSKCYLSVPYFQSLTDGHCLIAPIYHATCTTLLDEDIWEEMLNYCRKVVRMFRAQDKDVVFFENAMNFKYYPHMVIQCVPIPFESGNLAPIYFKKAILECEKEWSQNKKLVNVNKMDVKRAIPKGLPYFMVNFGLDYGFAHVIEEEKYFPKNFAQEVIGGMLDLDHRIWRKHRSDDFETQCKKVNTFKSMWVQTESSS